MTTVIYAGIAATALLSCAWDLRTARIPNVLTFGSAALGFTVYALTLGPQGAAFSAAGWVVGLLLFMPWFLLGGKGGGDVKLLAAFGAWLGPGQTAVACLFAMLAGGVMALAVVIHQRRFKSAMASTMCLAVHPTGGVGSPTGPAGVLTPRATIAGAVSVAVGVGSALWLR